MWEIIQVDKMILKEQGNHLMKNIGLLFKLNKIRMLLIESYKVK